MIHSHTDEMNIMDTLTDQVLLRRFVQSQDEAAFAALVRRHGPMVIGTCRRVLQHAQDTEDAFQASFLVLARKAPSIQNYQSLAGWLYKVAYRIALRARARRSQRQLRENCLAGKTDFKSVLQHGVGCMERTSEIDALVDDEVQRLPEKYRTPVLLCYLQGRTNEEAARQLRCPTGTVKIRLLRGREMLRKRLIRQGVALSLVGWLLGDATYAQAAVPPALLQATTAAACRLRSGTGLAQLGVSSQVVQFAKSWFQRVAIAKIKVAGAVLLTLLLLALTDRLAHQALGSPVSALPTDRIPTSTGPEDNSPPYPDQVPLEMIVKANHGV
jgi:RNA polymerase sigma factor (sigma-70 family)